MGVIVDNPRYERLAQCLAAGMRQADIARELDYTDKTVSDVKTLPIISKRVQELLEQHSQKLLNTGVIATIEERKAILTEILRSKTEQPISAGHKVASAKELNLMERVYSDTNSGKPGIVNITYVFNGLPAAPQAPTAPVIEVVEGKMLDAGNGRPESA